MQGDTLTIPDNAVGLRLCKVVREELILAEPIRFGRGAQGVRTVLARASISGRVGPVGETGDYWADLLDEDGDWFDTVALDKSSWGALKNRWMRCRIEDPEAPDD